MTKMLDLWQPPVDAGPPVGLVATSFTFDSDFFETQCLGRFLGIDSQRGESDSLLALIDEEERLAEVRVAVLLDRSERPDSRSLRWDLLTVSTRRGLQHAKVTVLVWEQRIRVLIGSANLTPAGYRSQVEIISAFDSFDGSDVPRDFTMDLLDAVGVIVGFAPGRDDRPGPLSRVRDTLGGARARVQKWDLPDAWPPGGLRAVVAPSRPGSSPLERFPTVWRGPVPRHADVLSPFFDTDPAGSVAAERLGELLARRGSASVRFCLPGDITSAGTVVRAPSALLARLPSRIEHSFELFRPEGDEPRRLHAKAIVLRSDEWVAALTGSSNFTSAGLGLSASTGHLEIDLWMGAAIGTAEADALLALVPDGDPFDPADARWEPEADEESSTLAPLPSGFADCLLDPKEGMCSITFLLEAADLPGRWTISLPGSSVLLTDDGWTESGRPEEIVVSAPAGPPPFFVTVSWTDHAGEPNSSPWAVNVTDPSALPPPEALRHLPAEAILAALASSRPLHEAMVRELERRTASEGGHLDALDPLKRFNTDGLFRRTRRLSAALGGMQDRLERPCWNADTARWRLRGPFGPVTVARRLIEESGAGPYVAGELAFYVAEIALMLSRVTWENAATPAVATEDLRREASEAIDEITSLLDGLEVPAALDDYVRRALAGARQ